MKINGASEVRNGALFPILLVVVGTIVYANSFSGVFFPDDENSIHNNASIRDLGDIGAILRPSSGGDVSGVSGRPLLNLSLAVNYAVGGLDLAGWHFLNVLVHLLSALLLYGIVRRTVVPQGLSPLPRPDASFLAFAIALLWMVHPLQTSSVTFVIQRAESFMGFFVLLSLYCAIRSFESSPSFRRTWWRVASVAACVGGMGFKEVAVVAPILILLYDRTFVGGSFASAFRRGWKLYAGFLLCWILLAVVLFTGGRLDAVSSKSYAVSPPDYALTQAGVVLHYLRLSLWPDPLVFHYYWPVAGGVAEAAVPLAAIGLLLLTTILLLRMKPWLGFLGAWFFLILAPSSSIVPIPREIAAEHRMYLPLVAVVALAVLGAAAVVARFGSWKKPVAWALLGSVALALGATTILRNDDYHSAEGMWRDVISKHPGSPVAHNNLGKILAAGKKFQEAADHFAAAVNLQPRDPLLQANLGSALAELKRYDEAILVFRDALKIDPDHLDTIYLLGRTLSLRGRHEEAIPHLQRVRSSHPGALPVLLDLAAAQAGAGRWEEAEATAREALVIAKNGGRPDIAADILDRIESYKSRRR